MSFIVIICSSILAVLFWLWVVLRTDEKFVTQIFHGCCLVSVVLVVVLSCLGKVMLL